MIGFSIKHEAYLFINITHVSNMAKLSIDITFTVFKILSYIASLPGGSTDAIRHKKESMVLFSR